MWRRDIANIWVGVKSIGLCVRDLIIQGLLMLVNDYVNIGDLAHNRFARAGVVLWCCKRTIPHF